MSKHLSIDDANEAFLDKAGAVLPLEKALESKKPQVQKPRTRSSTGSSEKPVPESSPEMSGQTFLADLCRPVQDSEEVPSTVDLHAAFATGRSFRVVCGGGGDMMLVSKRGMDMMAYLIEQNPPPEIVQATYAYSQLALLLSLHARDLAPGPTVPVKVSCLEDLDEAKV